MDFKKSNKITEIVRLQQILKKWRKLANSSKNSRKSNNVNNSNNESTKFLKRTVSLSNNSMGTGVSSNIVPKGYIAVCVGEELKRFVIPMEYLGHRAFGILLREAEEEFGFQQEGVLRIPCEVCVFERILKLIEERKEVLFMQEFRFSGEDTLGCCTSEGQLTEPLHPQSPMCR